MNRSALPRASIVTQMLAALVAVLALAGCAGGPGAARQTPVAVPGSELKDRITASDEPENMKRARTRTELAAAYFGRGEMTTALDQIKLAILADPTSGDAFNLRGLIYANLGDHALAEESFRRALALKPRDPDAMQNFGWYLCQQNRFPEADGYFTQALSVPQYREVPRTLLAQGVCQARAGRLAESETTLSRSYELDPGNAATAVNLSEVLYRRGEYERARFYVRRVNSVREVSNAQTLWLAARIENRLGNRNGVQDFGTQLRNRFPDSREASSYLRGAFDE